MKLDKCKQLIAIAALFGASASSQAALIYDSQLDAQGTGIGQVSTVLTLNNRVNQPNGTVSRENGADKITGNVQSNSPNSVLNATWSFGDLGISDASLLRIVFNPNEPQSGPSNAIQLVALTLSVYSDAGGSALFNTSLTGTLPLVFSPTTPGAGANGFMFRIDDDTLEEAQQYLLPTNRIGLSATIRGSSGGADTFYVAAADEAPATDVPEPGSVALLGLGLAGLTALRRRRKV